MRERFLLYEFLPIVASVISSFSRAGLNVCDRKVFRNDEVCPLVIGYWNNLLPIFITLPIIICTPTLNYCYADLLSFEIILLAAIIQCVSYSFSFAFKFLRVTDVAVLSKVADITVPLALVMTGFYVISYSFFMLLPAILAVFIFSAGVGVVKRAYKSVIVLILFLTVQGLYIFFIGYSTHNHKGLWGLMSVAFSLLFWRFVFSALPLVYGKKITNIYFFPKEFLTNRGFYLRGSLTVVAQVTFILAATGKNSMIVWPILNATGFLGAVFAYVFLGEKLKVVDYLFLSFAFFITGLAVLFQNYGNCV